MHTARLLHKIFSCSLLFFLLPLHAFMFPSGEIQYRFLVDGVWRCDESKPFMRDEYGLISNEVLVENNAQPVVQPEPSPIRGINMDEGTILTTVCLRSLILYFLVCIFLNYRSVIYCGLECPNRCLQSLRLKTQACK